MTTAVLEGRILDFIENETVNDFNTLAKEVFRFQFESLPEYRAHCEEHGRSPETVSSWKDVPTAAVDVVSKPDSGNDSIRESAEFRTAVVRAALPGLFSPESLWLWVDTGTESEPLLETLAGLAPEESLLECGSRVGIKPLRSWLGARQRDRRPVQVVAGSNGYAQLIEALDRRGLKFRLPPGSGAFCLTTVRGLAETSAIDVHEPLGLPHEAFRRVLSSRTFSTPLAERAHEPRQPFRLPHWVRRHVDDTGAVSVFDLASLAGLAHRIEPDAGDLVFR